MGFGIRSEPGAATRPTQYDVTVHYRGALDDCLQVYSVIDSQMQRASAHIDGETGKTHATLTVRWQGSRGADYAAVLREMSAVHEAARDEGITDQPLDDGDD